MAETKINKNQAGEGIYTQDNLIAGDNISITAETSGGADTLLLCHFNDSMNDSSSREVVAEGYTSADYGPLPIDATYVTGKFGKALNNTDYRYARYYHNDYQTELETSNEATIDFWILKDPNNYGYSYMTKLNINNTTDMTLFCYSSSVFAIYDPVFGGSLDNSDIDISSVTENTYFHIAMVYKNSVLKVYLNGVLQKTGTYNPSYLTCKGYIGLLAGVNATIDELRVSSVARWDSDFIPPSDPYGGSTPTGRYLINNTQDISSKANVSLDNLSDAGKILGSGLGMPTSQVQGVALTVGASGTLYTADHTGFVCVNATVTQGGFCYVTSGGLSTISQSYTSSTTIENWVPVLKGNTFTLVYSGATVQQLIFVYAEGSASEAS